MSEPSHTSAQVAPATRPVEAVREPSEAGAPALANFEVQRSMRGASGGAPVGPPIDNQDAQRAAKSLAGARPALDGAAQQLPHFDRIQSAFGRHDLSGVRTLTGGAARAASDDIGASAFASGQRIGFRDVPDAWLAAHESAHVIQQRDGAFIAGSDPSAHDGDPWERHADAVADAVVAGRSAEPLLDAMPGGHGRAPVQRSPATSVQAAPVQAAPPTAATARAAATDPGRGAPEPFPASSGDNANSFILGRLIAANWVTRWGDVLLDRLADYVAATDFTLPSTFAHWSPSGGDFARAFWAPIGAQRSQPHAILAAILAPDNLDRLVDAGRDAPMRTVIDPLGNASDPVGGAMWADAVVAEVGKVVVKRVIESLARITPRWLAARNQLALSANGPAKTADRDPTPNEIVPSHPIDRYVATGMVGHVAMDVREYRLQNPGSDVLGDMRLGQLKKVPYRWLHDSGAWNWIEALLAGATKEDVAYTLYGDATFAYGITDAAPYFGITNTENLAEPAATEFAQHSVRAQKPPGDGDDPDLAAPDQQMQVPSLLSDQVMLAEAKNVKPSGIKADEAGRKVLLDRMHAGLELFQLITKTSHKMPAGGYDNLVADAYKRLQDRRSKVADPANAMTWIVAWDGQTQAQNELLTQAQNGIATAVVQYGTFKKWSSSGVVTQQIGEMYLKVASLSEQAAAGRDALAAANQQSKLFPVIVMELVLAEIRKVLHTERGAKQTTSWAGETDATHDARTNLAEHDAREAKLRAGLARVRDKLLQNKGDVGEDLKKLVQELDDLQTEVVLVGDLDQMEAAWQALYDDISYVGVITGTNSDDADKVNGKQGHDPAANPSLREMHAEWTRIYARYRAGDKDGAVADLAAIRPKWEVEYPKIRELISDNETLNKWVTFGILVGIAVITAGVGAYVEGAAGAAWGATSWATWAATTGAEAVTFTSLSYLFVEKNPSIGGFFWELAKGFATFGVLKGISSKYVAFVGKEVAGAADTMLVQFVSLNTLALAEADIKKYALTGQHLTMDEAFEISKQNALFTIASGLATMAFKPGLETLKLKGTADGLLSTVRTAKVEFQRLAAELTAAKGNAEKTAAVLEAQRKWLAAENDALAKLDKLAADPKAAKKAGLDEEMKGKIDADRADHEARADEWWTGTILTYTEGGGPVRFAEQGAKWEAVAAFWAAKPGAKVEIIHTDGTVGARVVEITTPEGDVFRLLERTAADANAVQPSEVPVIETDPDPQATAEANRLTRIRDGEPGRVRPESELDNKDVADQMNSQLQKVKAGDVDAMLNKFPADKQSIARRILARAAGFARIESLNNVRDALQKYFDAGRKLYTPGGGALADSLAYVAGKGNFKNHPATDAVEITTELDKPCVVILDDVILAKLKDPAFAELVKKYAVLVQPRGFDSGINMFNATSPDAIAAKTQQLLDRVTAIQDASGGKIALDDAITQALDENMQAALKNAVPELAASVEVVDPAAVADTSSDAIADQLNSEAGITEAQLDTILAQATEADRAMLREVLAQQSEVFSTRRIGNALLSLHQHALAEAARRGLDAKDVYFLIPDAAKDPNTGEALAGGSFTMVATAHREVTGTPVDHYINGPAELAGRGLDPAKTMIVILDDVGGSGNSLATAAGEAGSIGGYSGPILVEPLVGTEMSQQRFTGPGGVTTNQPNVGYHPFKAMQALTETPFFKSLPPTQQDRLTALLNYLGYRKNALSMAFPYMAPDNNNMFFTDQIAKWFIMSQNRRAAKNAGTWKPRP